MLHHGLTKDCPTPLPNGACPGHLTTDDSRGAYLYDDSNACPTPLPNGSCPGHQTDRGAVILHSMKPPALKVDVCGRAILVADAETLERIARALRAYRE
jgi:hypothetical protein